MSGPVWRFYARGNTYQHRERITSWGWYWSPEDHAWCFDGASDESDLCIQAIARLPGVTVAKRDVSREPVR